MATQLVIAERRKKAEQLRIEGKSYPEIAAELKVSEFTARTDCIAAKKGPSDRELAIRKLKADGLTYGDIADILGVPRHAIEAKLKIRNNRPNPASPCSKCGQIANELACHHLDYVTDEWIPMCHSCHAKEHSEHRMIPRRRWRKNANEVVNETRLARGFSAMSKEKQRKIASMGGKKISENREHMRLIGQKGGKHSWNSVSEVVSTDAVTDASKASGIP